MQAAIRRLVIAVALLLLVALCILYIPPTIMRRHFPVTVERRLQQHVKLTADVHALRAELDRYKAANGTYPTTEQGLRVFVVTPKDP
jgi:Type II secretion system (T2SS), protein G